MTASMSWELDREHEEFRASVRAFVDRQVRPVVEEWEEAGRPPAALLKEMGSAGLLGLAVPEEYGGDNLAIVLLSEELARASGGIAVTALVTGYMSTPHIARFGTGEQRARYLPGLVSGEKIASIAVTEPGTGSDVAGITTRAAAADGGYRLDGTKMFITNAGIADVFVVAARTSPDGHRGITTFIVEAGQPGLRLGRTAVIWEGEPGDVRTVTYVELASEVTRLAAALASHGVARGDVVAIYMPNAIEAFTAVHACNRIGAVYTILFSGFGADAVRSRLEASRAKVVLVLDASYRRGKLVPLLDTLRAARGTADTVEHTIVADRTGRGVPLQAGEISYADALGLAPGGVPAVPLEANDPAFLIFTSGTEARPKGVVHSVAGFLLGTWANVRWQVGPEDGDVYWVAADVGWLTFPIQAVVGGLANGMTVACFEGAMDTPSNARCYEICEKHHVTKVLGAPTLLRMLRKYGDELAAAHPLPDLRLVTVQGEPLDGETFTWATRHLGGGVPVVNAYGQTETGSTWAYSVAGVEALKPGSTGTVVPGHVYDILDDNGKPVPPGTKGNLVLTQPFPTLARTVWDDPERYQQAYFARFPGCYCTNDDAVLDADGHLWVLGRADDVINVAAHRISTLEIEAIATAHPQVAEAAVVGVSDATKGTVPVAFLTLLDGADPGRVRQEVSAEVASQLGGYARLGAVYLTSALPKTRTTSALPKTRTGKIMRRPLRDVVEYGGPQGDTSTMEDLAGLQAVQQAVAAEAARSA